MILRMSEQITEAKKLVASSYAKYKAGDYAEARKLFAVALLFALCSCSTYQDKVDDSDSFREMGRFASEQKNMMRQLNSLTELLR